MSAKRTVHAFRAAEVLIVLREEPQDWLLSLHTHALSQGRNVRVGGCIRFNPR